MSPTSTVNHQPVILLPMQSDPMEEWRRLTALYSEMGDLEIHEFAALISDLTPSAQQILRDELKKRGMAGNSTSLALPNRQDPHENLAAVHWDDRDESTQTMVEGARENGATDYTWKTGLCRCDSLQVAAQRGEMLRRAGIDSWVQRPGARFVVPWVDELGAGDIQINVAADQLDQAKALIVQPIPQDIIDDLKDEEATPAFEIPICPKCGADDSTLESVEPSNNWLCESCGHTWTDPIPDLTESQPAT